MWVDIFCRNVVLKTKMVKQIGQSNIELLRREVVPAYYDHAYRVMVFPFAMCADIFYGSAGLNNPVVRWVVGPAGFLRVTIGYNEMITITIPVTGLVPFVDGTGVTPFGGRAVNDNFLWL